MLKDKIAARPTETVTGAALAGTVFGLLTQEGVPIVVAAIVGAVVGFGPAAVSETVDGIKDQR